MSPSEQGGLLLGAFVAAMAAVSGLIYWSTRRDQIVRTTRYIPPRDKLARRIDSARRQISHRDSPTQADHAEAKRSAAQEIAIALCLDPARTCWLILGTTHPLMLADVLLQQSADAWKAHVAAHPNVEEAAP